MSAYFASSARKGPIIALALAFALPAGTHAQTLTLAQAIDMAKRRNGTVQAAFLDVEAARSRTRETFGAFLPTVTPSYEFDTRHNRLFTGPFQGRSGSATHSTQIAANWRILDSGQREWAYQASRKSEEASVASATQIVRNILFTVNQQFFDALRSQELLRVSSAQVGRASKIQDQTQAQIEVGAAAKKDILQVRADLLNAEVSRLSAENQSSVSEASLKATIGLESKAELGDLVAEAEPLTFAEPETLEQSIQFGLANRPDLIALRKRRDAQKYFVKTADRESKYTWTLDAGLTRSFSEDVSDFRGLTFLVSLPLFDGQRSKEAARQQRLGLLAQEADLVQAEREAQADIESAHALLRQDIRRVAAAKLAREAAQLNYDAALESQRLGAEGTDIITVLTAQVSLVTAESNYVDALYDYFISDVRLKLVTGRTMPGETS